MKLIVDDEPKTFKVELTREQINYIRSITQNCSGSPDDEDKEDAKIRLSIFIGASRIIGYNMNDDGTVNR